MADDGIEGLLGDEKGGIEVGVDVAAADGIAMVVSMDDAKNNPDVAEGVLEYLERQSLLVDLQLWHFDASPRASPIERDSHSACATRSDSGCVRSA